MLYTIIKLDIPLRPSQPVVYDITNRSCVLEWMAPDFDGGSPITRYEVKIKQDDKKWKYGCSVSGDKLSTKVENLSENKTYRFRIRAVNIAGHGKKGPKSEAIKAIGKEYIIEKLRISSIFVEIAFI